MCMLRWVQYEPSDLGVRALQHKTCTCAHCSTKRAAAASAIEESCRPVDTALIRFGIAAAGTHSNLQLSVCSHDIADCALCSSKS